MNESEFEQRIKALEDKVKELEWQLQPNVLAVTFNRLCGYHQEYPPRQTLENCTPKSEGIAPEL